MGELPVSSSIRVKPNDLWILKSINKIEISPKNAINNGEVKSKGSNL